MRFIASLVRVLVFALCALTVTLAFSQTAGASQQHKCVADLGIAESKIKAATTKRVLLTVHGYNETRDVWDDGSDTAMAVAIKKDEVEITHFDYAAANTRWVTDPEIAPRLAQYIACYSILSKRPVILLAHSMGGLAAREAFDSAAYGIRIKNVVGHVITIAPPHKGSRFADAESYFWLSACEAPFGALLVDACKQINAARATGGMQVGSEQLAKLAHFPPDVSVKTIAGDVAWQACLPWGCSPAASTGGDLVVPIESATAEYTTTGHGDGKKVFTCESDTLVSPWSSAWCEHNNLLKAKPVQDEVVSSIRQYLRYAELAKDGGQFVGEWYADGVFLTFNPDKTGTQITEVGACVEDNPDFSCRVIVAFTWQPVNNGLRYTVQSLRAVAEPILGATIPADDMVDLSKFEQPGTTLPIKFKSAGLIEGDPKRAHNWHFCRYTIATVEELKLCV